MKSKTYTSKIKTNTLNQFSLFKYKNKFIMKWSNTFQSNCQGSFSAPSEDSLFSGLYPVTIGCIDNISLETDIMQNVRALQKALQDNKWTCDIQHSKYERSFNRLTHISKKALTGYRVYLNNASQDSAHNFLSKEINY